MDGDGKSEIEFLVFMGVIGFSLSVFHVVRAATNLGFVIAKPAADISGATRPQTLVFSHRRPFKNPVRITSVCTFSIQV